MGKRKLYLVESVHNSNAKIPRQTLHSRRKKNSQELQGSNSQAVTESVSNHLLVNNEGGEGI